MMQGPSWPLVETLKTSKIQCPWSQTGYGCGIAVDGRPAHCCRDCQLQGESSQDAGATHARPPWLTRVQVLNLSLCGR